MRAIALILSASVALSGCMEGATALSGGIGGGGGGKKGAEARKLSNGMSRASADAIFGLDAGFERNPANWDESCVSYAYGAADSPRYVHAVFVGDRMSRATDGHSAICTYGSAV